MRIALGSTNPTKYNATRIACETVFPDRKFEFICMEGESSVSKQPFGDETIRGAIERAIKAQEHTNADLGVGIEGGIEKTPYGAFAIGWCAVTDQNKKMGLSSTGSMPMPQKVLQLMEQEHIDLGPAIDRITGQKDTKQKQAFNGYITKNILDRTSDYVHMIIYALSPFYNPEAFELKTAKKTIYFSAAGNGNPSQLATYQTIMTIIKSLGNQVLSEYEGEASETPIPGSDPYQRNMERLKHSDLVVAEVSEPSVSLGFEIAYALHRQMPVIALFSKNASQRLNPLIASHQSRLIRVFPYTPSELEEILQKIFSEPF